ncbi:MAG TPA: hypothetical protein VGH46_05705 [Gaiellaceae bacterium]|jgi:hypothetical protein
MATAAAASSKATSEGSTSPSTSTGATVSTTEAAKTPSRWELKDASVSRRQIRHYRADTRHWLTVIRGRPPASGARLLAARSSAAQLRQLARRWRHRAHRAWWQANHPPELRDWLCIHRYEGSWADSGSPYWGGLQMDLSFQQTYGGWLLRHKGTADHWSPLEQIWVAVRASHSRGFSPWPNTARDCGLY